MASLTNCLEVQSIVFPEYEGDQTIIDSGTNLLETQGNWVNHTVTTSSGDEPTIWMVNQQYLLSETPFWNSNAISPGKYWMIIEPLPGYSIEASMINIGGILGACVSGSEDIKGWFRVANLPLTCGGNDGQWPLFPEITIPDEVASITAYNAKQPGSCGNYVVLKVILLPDWEMPGSDKTIKIDFGGTAIECEEPTVAGAKAIQHQLLINAPAWEQVGSDLAQHGNFEIYTARYFPSAEYAESQYLICNNLYYGTATALGNMSVMKPTYDFLGVCPSDKYTDGSFNSFQPEVFDRYKMFIDSQGWFDTSNVYANVTTTCGELSAQWGSLGVSGSYWSAENYDISNGGSIPPSHPHQDLIEGGWNRGYNYGYHFQPYTSTANASDWYYGIDTTVTPVIEPGDGILPPILAWHISVGDNPNYDLIANSETVDVWKIVSYDTDNLANTFQQIEEQQGCPASLDQLNDPVNTFFGKSEKDVNGNTISNDSNLNINVVDLQQIDDKTIRLAIPWNPNVQYDLTPQEFKMWHTKIFINIYPSEV